MSPAARAAAKIVGLVLFAAVVVALPRDVVWPYAIPFVVALVFLVRARAPWRWVLPRLTVEIPFLVFAMVLPFVALGPRVAVGPFALSVDGLWAGWALFAKGTISVLAALAFARSTPAEDARALGFSTAEQMETVRRSVLEESGLYALCSKDGRRWNAAGNHSLNLREVAPLLAAGLGPPIHGAVQIRQVITPVGQVRRGGGPARATA